MIDISLGSLGEGNGVFHDLRYTNTRAGGNQNEITFEVNNVSGNPMFIEMVDEDGKAYHLENTKKVKIHIQGTIEEGEFLNMLRLILETEKIVSILK